MAARTFRHDIAALRAIAVLAVLAYHFRIPPFSSGFVGVEVFFVISGYLITGIVTRRLGAGRFSLWAFYLARVRRVVPGMIAVCGTLLVVGLLIIDPIEYDALAKSAASALTFTSNFLFQKGGGYFQEAPSTEWLLHTWTLSVEWQFYLLYPLWLMLVWRSGWLRDRLFLLLLLGAALSLSAAALVATKDETWAKTAFYMLPFRVWEFLLGALAAVRPSRLKPLTASICLGVGLGMIAFSLVAFDMYTPWPSWRALVPTMGALLVIWAAAPDAAWARAPGLQAIGRWSYSIYLWHWPIAVALTKMDLKGPLVTGGALAASIAIGALSYRWIENWATRSLFDGPGLLRRTPLMIGLLAAPLTLAVIAAKTNGLEYVRTIGMRPEARAAMADYRAAKADWRYPGVCSSFRTTKGVLHCYIGNPSARMALVIGDSYAQQVTPRYASLFAGKTGEGVTFATESGCLLLPGMEKRKPGKRCVAKVDEMFDLAEHNAYRRVVVASAWTIYLYADPAAPMFCFMHGGRCQTPNAAELPGEVRRSIDRLEARLARLTAQGKDVVVVLPIPLSPRNAPGRLYGESFRSGRAVAPYPASPTELTPLQKLEIASIKAATLSAGARLVDPLATLCHGDVCLNAYDGRTVYWDPYHYRASAITKPALGYFDEAVLDPRLR